MAGAGIPDGLIRIRRQTSKKGRQSKVTLQDLADAASVSKATASLALRANPRISERDLPVQRTQDAVTVNRTRFNRRARLVVS